MSAWKLLLALVIVSHTACSLLPAAGAEHVWVVQVDEGGDKIVRSLARSHSLEYGGQMPHLRNKFVLRLGDVGAKQRRMKRSPDGARIIGAHEIVHRRLQRHPKITWVSYQTEVKREKRDYIPYERVLRGYEREAPAIANFNLGDGGRRAVSDFSPAELNRNAGRLFVDPLWPRQWYLHDTRDNPSKPKLDLHVIPAWRRNLTGRGIVVAIVDDGLERDHPDLVANYDPRASYNFNNGTSDPMPKYADLENERHGTRCAGEVAMQANNSHCGVGVAFNARIGGIKILDGGMSDLLEASGLTHALDYVDIYSASWGPTDDGATMEAPGPLAREALKVGTQRGRGGKGVVYVWASGNGGAFGDNCNCDGYASSVYTIAVSSATQTLSPPWYSEHCSATLATTFSSGSRREQRMVSTDLRHRCTERFTGTSASAPIASGIVALLLEANSNLTYRDVQHVIVWTAEVAPLLGNSGWRENAAGHRFHQRFGFGLFNVAAMAELVRPDRWRRVPDKAEAQLDNWHCRSGWRLSRSNAIRCQLTVSRSTDSSVKYLEHVQLSVNLTYPERGALAIFITSPAGTTSQLLTRRKHDRSKSGLPSWAFMTVHFWGESPAGIWTVDIEDQSENSTSHHGVLQQMQLILHGTPVMPDHRIQAGGRRVYNHNYNFVKNMHPNHQNKRQRGRRHRRAAAEGKLYNDSDKMLIGRRAGSQSGHRRRAAGTPAGFGAAKPGRASGTFLP